MTKKLAVLTSGGDAPGMNAAIRAVVRTGIEQGFEVIGFRQGYSGLIKNDYIEFNLRSVANILQRGGTILKSGRSEEFKTEAKRSLAKANLKQHQLKGLIVIGGDGSLTGAHTLFEETALPVAGIPATIDNDIFGTEYCIGFDTALNTSLEAIDRIRDTAASHDRLFIVEVMGRNSGHLAAHVALAGGAEEVFIPEMPLPMDQAIRQIQESQKAGKMSSILVAAEGQKPGRAYDLAEAIRKKAGFEAKVCILGHIQRGGSPTAQDRILASRLGAAAVYAIDQGQADIMIGIDQSQEVSVPLETMINNKKQVRPYLLDLIHTLSK